MAPDLRLELSATSFGDSSARPRVRQNMEERPRIERGQPVGLVTLAT